MANPKFATYFTSSFPRKRARRAKFRGTAKRESSGFENEWIPARARSAAVRRSTHRLGRNDGSPCNELATHHTTVSPYRNRPTPTDAGVNGISSSARPPAFPARAQCGLERALHPGVRQRRVLAGEVDAAFRRDRRGGTAPVCWPGMNHAKAPLLQRMVVPAPARVSRTTPAFASCGCTRDRCRSTAALASSCGRLASRRAACPHEYDASITPGPRTRARSFAAALSDG